MNRINKLFGRKAEQASKAEEDMPDNEAQVYEAGAPSESQDQVFGLKFTIDNGESMTLSSLPISIGRDAQNDIVLNDETMSARHARIYFDEYAKDICIEDTDSLNGLFIDGNPTRKNVLFDGVEVRLGNVSLSFRDTGYIHPG